MLKTFRDKFLLEIVVFTSGALVMVFEIIGSRILAPYIGTSTYVWTSLIGIILGALSLGYWLGGKAADKKPDIGVLAIVLFMAGGLISVTILLNPIILSAIAEAPAGLEIKSVIAALILFAPASVLFGFVTPYAIRLKLLSIEDSGRTIGRLYALSTIGSIIGTFAAGFFLLPFVGSTRTLYIIAAILFALSLLIAPFKLATANVFILLLLPFSIILSEAIAYMLYRSNEVIDFDTEYSHVRVFRYEDEKTKKAIRALTTNPQSSESAMFIDSDDLVLPYTRYYHLIRHFKPDFEKVLMIGGAAYSFPKDYLRVYPDKKIDVVEIDPKVTDIARKYFRLNDDPDLQIFHEDGRTFLNKVPSKKYDTILVDAFTSVYSIPFHLTTKEAVAKMHNSLTDDGVVIVNIISALEGKKSLFLQAEYKTYKEVFPNVLLLKVNSDERYEDTQNLVLVAAKTSKFNFESKDAEISGLLQTRLEKEIEQSVPALTDELAPVEYYFSYMHGASK